MITIGLMLVVRNEIKRIKECLDWHLPFVDEVAICDQESDDGTWEYLGEMLTKSKVPVQLIQDKKWGFCEPSKQKTADLLHTEWILYVDPDEKFSIEFLKNMNKIIEEHPETNGFLFPRYNFFDVQVFDDSVPIEPKWLTIQHPKKDPQLRLTRATVSKFPEFLHHRVRVENAKGEKLVYELPYPIEHHKTLTEQWDDQKRYGKVGKDGIHG